MECVCGGMNRTERALLGMAVVFTVLSSLFTHLCWELKAAHQLCASVSGCVAMVAGTLCLACLDMWRLGPAGSHTAATLLTQYLRTRYLRTRAACGNSRTLTDLQQNQKRVLHTLQRTGLFHKTQPSGIFSRQTLANLLHDFQREVPLCKPCLDRENEDGSKGDRKASDVQQSLGHYDQFYRHRIGIKREMVTLKRVARLQMGRYSAVPINGPIPSKYDKYELENNNMNLDYEYREKCQNSESDDLSMKGNDGLKVKDTDKTASPPFCQPRHIPKDVLRVDLKEGEGGGDVMQRQALLLLLEEDLGILQSPDVATLVHFLSYVENNLSLLCKQIRRHCNQLNSKGPDNTNGKVRTMPNKGITSVITASGALCVDYLQRREVALRVALVPEVGVWCLASRVWPCLRLVSVLHWDPACQRDFLGMRVTTCRLPEVVVSVWVPPGGGVWGQTCSGCGVTSPAFRLHVQDGFIEYLDVKKGDVRPMDQLLLGVQYELVVTTLSGAIRRRTGHIVQVVKIHEGELPCFRIISNCDSRIQSND